MLSSLEAIGTKIEQAIGGGKRRNSNTGELERISSSAREEARKLSQGRRGSAGTAAQASVQQHAAHGHPVAGTAVAEEDEGTAAPIRR